MSPRITHKKHSSRGITVVLVLVFAAVFTLSVTALMSFIFAQTKLAQTKEVREVAFGIAEAGLAYYHWFLIDNPTDTQNGTGTSGPYTRTYTDPDTGEALGTYNLTVVGNTACGQLQSIDITSEGLAAADSRFSRTVFARHAYPSVAEFAYIIGTDVWAGADRAIVGAYHSNGGIRMDGTNNSLVTSGVSSWSASFNCDSGSPSDGVCGDGPHTALWQYPVAHISFDDMALDFPDIKSYAQQDGVYLAPYGDTEIDYFGLDVAVDGYRLSFNADGTVDIYQVTETTGYQAWHRDIGGTFDFHVIAEEVFLERRSIPSDCALIFVEDKLWVEGVVNGKVTIVAADLVNDYRPDVILNENIRYADNDGSDGLTVISEGAVLIPPRSPDTLSLQGIFVAQGRYFGRPYYAGDTKTQLTIDGTIVSRGRVGTAWVCGGETFCSGYAHRTNTYDRLQMTNPPAFTPASTTTAEYILWQEL